MKRTQGSHRVHIAQSYADVVQLLENELPRWGADCFRAAFAATRIAVCNALIAMLRRILDLRRSPTSDVQSILIYTVGILGDNIVMVPALRVIRERFPQARVTLVNNSQVWNGEPASQVFRLLPYIDRFVPIANWDCPIQRHGARFELVIPELSSESCDLFINLSPFGNRGWFGAVMREMLWARRLGAKSAAGFRVSTYCPVASFRRTQHRFFQNEPTRYLSILKEMGLTEQGAPGEPVFRVSRASKETVCGKLTARGVDPAKVFIVNPGAKFAANRWPPERFAAVIRSISVLLGSTAVVTGTASEAPLVRSVLDSSDSGALSLAGETTVAELIELVRLAKLCVTNDTGTMHIAAALGVPTVAIFSRRHPPQNWFPHGPKTAAIFSSVSCSSCGLETCPSLECLLDVGVDDVVHACKQILGMQ